MLTFELGPNPKFYCSDVIKANSSTLPPTPCPAKDPELALNFQQSPLNISIFQGRTLNPPNPTLPIFLFKKSQPHPKP